MGKSHQGAYDYRRNDLDPELLMMAIHYVEMAGNLFYMTASHETEQESTRTS